VADVEILYIARNYADAGDYAGALEVGGAAAGRYGSDPGIRGYVAHVMFQHGKKEEAETLLTETLRAIDNGSMPLHRDFIVGLILCGKVDDAVQRITTMQVVDPSEPHRDGIPAYQYAKTPMLLLRSLLMSGREAEAVKLVDEWKFPNGKAWGIRTLLQWNQEEYLDKGTASFFTPELNVRWIDFLIHYANTLEEPSVTARLEEWYRTAECLTDLGAREAALKILDKALEDIGDFDKTLPESPGSGTAHIRSDSVNTRIQIGRLLIRLGEREKADIAFTAAIKDFSLIRIHHLIDLRVILFNYTDFLLEEKPEHIRTWSGYQKRNALSRPRTLRTQWKDRLFSMYMIM